MVSDSKGITGGNDVWYSGDGLHWSLATAEANFRGRWGHAALVYNDKIWIFGGTDGSIQLSDVWFSGDGINWAIATSDAGFDKVTSQTSVAFKGKMYLLASLMTSESNIRSSEKDINYVWSSADGIVWSRSSMMSFSGSFNMLCYKDTIWLIGAGPNDDVWSSTDGIDFSKVTDSAGFNYIYAPTSLVYLDKMWAIGGQVSSVWHSQ